MAAHFVSKSVNENHLNFIQNVFNPFVARLNNCIPLKYVIIFFAIFFHTQVSLCVECNSLVPDLAVVAFTYIYFFVLFLFLIFFTPYYNLFRIVLLIKNY